VNGRFPLIVLDLEVKHSPDDLPTGWTDKYALGLSIGGYWDCQRQCLVWFDQHTVVDVLDWLTATQPTICTFNGKSFDLPVMVAEASKGDQSLMQRWYERLEKVPHYDMCELFRQEARAVGFTGRNSLEQITRDLGLGGKSGHGAQAPALWQQGRLAELLNYARQDIMLTRALCAHVTRHGGHVTRQGVPFHVPHLCATDGQSLDIVRTCARNHHSDTEQGQ
jgi:hypothetical protein